MHSTPVMVVRLWGIKSIFLFFCKRMYYHAQSQQSIWLWHKVAMQKTPQTKMLIPSHQVNTYSMDWTSWKANASTQEYRMYLHVITTEGVDFKSSDNFFYFCTQNTEKWEFPNFSQTRKKGFECPTLHQILVFTLVRKNKAQKVKYCMMHRKQSLLLNN